MKDKETVGRNCWTLRFKTLFCNIISTSRFFSFPIFFCYITSFSLESTRVFDLIVPRWPRFPVHLVGLISSSFSTLFLLSSEEIPYSLSFPPDLPYSPFSSPFFFFILWYVAGVTWGAETKQRWCEVQIVVVVGCKKRRGKKREMKDRREPFFLSAQVQSVLILTFLLQDVDDTIDRILNIHTDRQLFNFFFFLK